MIKNCFFFLICTFMFLLAQFSIIYQGRADGGKGNYLIRAIDLLFVGKDAAADVIIRKIEFTSKNCIKKIDYITDVGNFLRVLP